MLAWGKKRQKKGSKTRVKWYLKPPSHHRIWVKWSQKYVDDPSLEWSAEKQRKYKIFPFLQKIMNFLSGNFTGEQIKLKIKKLLQEKTVFPWPSFHDGERSGWQKRAKIARRLGYKEWTPTTKEESGTWVIYNCNKMSF